MMNGRGKHIKHTVAQEPPRRCREVVCPSCAHRFMWLESRGSLFFPEYRRKGTKEFLDQAVCPACGARLALFPGELTAVSPGQDDRVEMCPERGI
jgi:hypothetical protein